MSDIDFDDYEQDGDIKKYFEQFPDANEILSDISYESTISTVEIKPMEPFEKISMTIYKLAIAPIEFVFLECSSDFKESEKQIINLEGKFYILGGFFLYSYELLIEASKAFYEYYDFL